MRNHAALAFDPKAFLSRIENGKSTREYRSRQVVFSQGDAADAVFYVQSGKVKLTVVSTRGKEAVIGVLEQGSSCLSACFSTQQWVAYRDAQAAVPQEPSAVSAAVRQRGSVRGLPDRVPLAGGLRLSQVRSRVWVCLGWPASMAVRFLPLPGLGDGRDGSSQLQDAALDVVLGRLLDDDGQAWSLGLALAAPTRDRPLRDRMDDSPQASSSDGEHGSGASPGRGRA